MSEYVLRLTDALIKQAAPKDKSVGKVYAHPHGLKRSKKNSLGAQVVQTSCFSHKVKATEARPRQSQFCVLPKAHLTRRTACKRRDQA